MEGKCILVTGASRGIGLNIAQQLAGAGYDLALVDIDADGAADAAAVLRIGAVCRSSPGCGKIRNKGMTAKRSLSD